MEWIIDNWYVVLAFVAVLTCAGFAVYHFFGLPTDKQVAKVKEWLLYAVIEAEKKFGSGTGVAKLRYVYDCFVARFPYMAKIVSFEMFSFLVDEALEIMRKELEKNKELSTYVGKEEA